MGVSGISRKENKGWRWGHIGVGTEMKVWDLSSCAPTLRHRCSAWPAFHSSLGPRKCKLWPGLLWLHSSRPQHLVHSSSHSWWAGEGLQQPGQVLIFSSFFTPLLLFTRPFSPLMKAEHHPAAFVNRPVKEQSSS